MAFDDTLKQAGVSDAAIQILRTQEFEREEDLQRGFSYEQFTSMGIAAKSARILADRYPVKAAAPAPAQPQTVQLVTGNPRDMRLTEIVRAVAGGEQSQDYIAALRALVSDRRVFVRNIDTGGIDAEETLAHLEEIGGGTPHPFWGRMPTEALDTILKKQRFANPLTGQPIAKGDEWLQVSTVRREMIAYGRLAGLLPTAYDEDTIIEKLLAETLAGRYERWMNAYRAAEQARDPLAAQAKEALYYQEGGHGRSANPFVVAPVATVARVSSVEIEAVARVDAPAMPVFPPAVPGDFRTLTRLYLQDDKQGMEDFLYRRGLYLEMTDLEPKYIECVPFEALCLLRAGSSRGTFESANSIGEPGWLEQAVGMRRAELLCQGDFYQALRQTRPDPSDPLVLWCSTILFSDRFMAGNTVRPNPYGRPGNNWRGQKIYTHR